MLNAIKATYFYKVVFSCLNEKTKLKFAKYNKNLQNIIGINLNNYKFFNRRHIEYDLYTNKKLFEGNYLNDKKNIYSIEY